MSKKLIGAIVAIVVSAALAAGPAAASAAMTTISYGETYVGYGQPPLDGGAFRIFTHGAEVGETFPDSSGPGLKWKIRQGNSVVGHAVETPGKWVCYAGGSIVGYVTGAEGNRFNDKGDIYIDGSKVGRVSGPEAGQVGCAAVVFGLLGPKP